MISLLSPVFWNFTTSEDSEDGEVGKDDEDGEDEIVKSVEALPSVDLIVIVWFPDDKVSRYSGLSSMIMLPSLLL